MGHRLKISNAANVQKSAGLNELRKFIPAAYPMAYWSRCMFISFLRGICPFGAGLDPGRITSYKYIIYSEIFNLQYRICKKYDFFLFPGLIFAKSVAYYPSINKMCEHSSVVEHHVANVMVVGSSPIARSIFFLCASIAQW